MYIPLLLSTWSHDAFQTCPPLGSDTSSPINVTLILYEDDSLFPSVSKIQSSLSVVEGVVSLEVKGGTLMALTEPVVTEFQVL